MKDYWHSVRFPSVWLVICLLLPFKHSILGCQEGLTRKKCWNCSRSISCQEQKRVAFDLISRVNNPGPRWFPHWANIGFLFRMGIKGIKIEKKRWKFYFHRNWQEKFCWNSSQSISCQEQKRVAIDLISHVNNSDQIPHAGSHIIGRILFFFSTDTKIEQNYNIENFGCDT